MFISLSITLPSDARKKRKAKRASSSEPKRIPRVNAETFRTMSKGKQKKYLERYPNSSHRFILKRDRKARLVEKERAAERNKTPEPLKLNKVSRDTYDTWTKRKQSEYDKKFSGERKFKGPKDPTIKRGNVVKRKAQEAKLSAESPRIKQMKAEAAASMTKHRKLAVSELRRSLTPESMKAVQQIEQQDIDKAVENIKKNKDDILESFERKLEEDRLDIVEVTDEDRADLQSIVDRSGDVDLDELEEIIDNPEPTREQKRVTEEVLDKPSSNFLARDLKTMSDILTGKYEGKNGRGTFITAMSIIGRYALIAGGVSLIAIGGAPLAIHIAKEVYDGWQALSSDEDQELDLDRVLDVFIQNLAYTDLEELKGIKAKGFVSESSAKRVSYRPMDGEKLLPFNKRTCWDVMYDDQKVASLYTDDKRTSSSNSRCWKAVVYTNFDALSFPDCDDHGTINEPYLVSGENNVLELHCPMLMNLQEARNWVRSIIER